jgi:hypothetical protein
LTTAEKPEGGTGRTADKAVAEYTQDRYLTRILKGMALPLLYTIISVMMLRNYTLEYPNYFDYEVLFIALGALLGGVAITGSTLFNVLKAKKNTKMGAKLTTKTIILVYIPIFLIVVLIALFFGLSKAWQFSIGFFATTLVPPLFVLAMEVASKGHFYVREYERPSKMRYLVLVRTATG